MVKGAISLMLTMSGWWIWLVDQAQAALGILDAGQERRPVPAAPVPAAPVREQARPFDFGIPGYTQPHTYDQNEQRRSKEAHGFIRPGQSQAQDKQVRGPGKASLTSSVLSANVTEWGPQAHRYLVNQEKYHAVMLVETHLFPVRDEEVQEAVAKDN